MRVEIMWKFISLAAVAIAATVIITCCSPELQPATVVAPTQQKGLLTLEDL